MKKSRSRYPLHGGIIGTVVSFGAGVSLARGYHLERMHHWHEGIIWCWQKKLHQETPKNDREIFPVFERIGIDATVDLELRLMNGRWLGVRTSSAASLRLLLEAMI